MIFGWSVIIILVAGFLFGGGGTVDFAGNVW